MWWVEWSGLEFFSTLGLPTIQVLDRQDMRPRSRECISMNPVISWIVLLGSSVAPKKVDVQRWRLFVLARERKCEAFTSRQRTSSQERLEGNEAVIVGGVEELLH